MKPILGFKALAYVVLLSAGIWAGITEAAIITFNEFDLMHGDSINTSVNSQYLTNFGLTATQLGLTQFDPLEINFGGSAAVDNIRTSPVPEPATMLMVGSGLIVLAGIGRKKFIKKKK